MIISRLHFLATRFKHIAIIYNNYYNYKPEIWEMFVCFLHLNSNHSSCLPDHLYPHLLVGGN